MARKKQQSKFLKNLLIICLPLILVQSFILFKYKRGANVVSFKDAMNDVLTENDKIAVDQRSIIKIQLALSDFRIKGNKYPDSLEELIPKYFDEIPIDPETAEPFRYLLSGDFYLLGQAAIKTSPAGQSDITTDETDALLDSLDSINQEIFVYDPTGKRDPFRTFDFSNYDQRKKGATPLEQYDYKQLKLSAVLLNTGEPKAIIEDGTGKGHTVKIGSPISFYGGKIVKIEVDRVVILEETIEFTGEKATRTIDLYLPKETKDYGSLTREQTLGESEVKITEVIEPIEP